MRRKQIVQLTINVGNQLSLTFFQVCLFATSNGLRLGLTGFTGLNACTAFSLFFFFIVGAIEGRSYGADQGYSQQPPHRNVLSIGFKGFVAADALSGRADQLIHTLAQH
ncbi:hypothetical protein D3C81_1372360 [compost metagenome]